jgi:hypothetical protein
MVGAKYGLALETGIADKMNSKYSFDRKVCKENDMTRKSGRILSV